MIKNFLKILPLGIILTSCGAGVQVTSNSTSSSTGRTSKIIFITTATTNGDIRTSGGGANGIAGADALCQAEASANGITTAKALIVDSANRIACTSANCTTSGNAEHVDWVLQANKVYTRTNGVTIGTTNSFGLFTFPLGQSFGPGNGWAWTGISTNYTTNATRCNDWTDGTAGPAGIQGSETDSTSSAINGGGAACNGTVKLYCVEQ